MSYSKIHESKSTKKIIILAASLAVLILLVTAAYLYTNQHKNNTESALAGTYKICSSALVVRASKDIASGNLALQKKDYQEVIKMKNYQGDVNCSYIITNYLISISDTKNLNVAMNSLKSNLANQQKLSPALTSPKLPTVSSLQGTVTYLNNLSTQVDNSRRYDIRQVPEKPL